MSSTTADELVTNGFTSVNKISKASTSGFISNSMSIEDEAKTNGVAPIEIEADGAIAKNMFHEGKSEASGVPIHEITSEDNLSNKVKPLETFTIFSELPLEIRRKIWYHSLPDSRVIEIETIGIWGTHGCQQQWIFTPQSMQRSPTLYRINREARCEFLRFYRPISLGVETPAEQESKDLGQDGDVEEGKALSPTCLFDPNVDILYLAENVYFTFTKDMMAHLNLELLKELRCLAIKFEDFWSASYDEALSQHIIPRPVMILMGQNLRALLSITPQLKSLIVIVREVRGYSLPGGLIKPIRSVEMEEIIQWHEDDEPSTRVKEEIQTWVDDLVRFCPETAQPVVTLKQILRVVGL